jgi:hypothetical protein
MGDLMWVYRREHLRSFRFTEFAGEPLMPENLLFDHLDSLGPSRLLHGTFYLCRYQPDGYSHNIERHRAASPRGFAASLESAAWASRRAYPSVKYTLNFQVWSRAFFGHFGFHEFRRRFLWVLCRPMAQILFFIRRPAFIFRTHALRPHPGDRR